MAQVVQHMPDSAPDKTKPYGLLNSDGSTADWFATHDAAVAGMRKTSQASRMYSESDHYFGLSHVNTEFADGDGVWIEALQAKEYHTSEYGKVDVSGDKLNNLVDSVKKNVRGIELSTDYNHGRDVAKGNKASGTIKDAKIDGDKLMLQVAFTDTAKAEIKAGEWKYFSSDWADSYTHEDGTKYTDVLLGGGLTNRPVAKSLNPLPINFSELFDVVPINTKKLSEDKSMNELLKRLATELGIEFSETTDETQLGESVFAELKKLSDEVEPLRKLKETVSTQKSFAEEYPDQHKQMLEDAKFRIEAKSEKFAETIGTKRFSENVGSKDAEGNDVIVTTTKGFSGKALEAIKETHRKFAEGTVTVEDFANTVDTILDNGIADYSEIGTSTTGGNNLVTGEDVVVTGDLASSRNSFAERVTEVLTEMQADPANKDRVVKFEEALGAAAVKYPKMYEAYMGRSVTV